MYEVQVAIQLFYQPAEYNCSRFLVDEDIGFVYREGLLRQTLEEFRPRLGSFLTCCKLPGE